MRSRIIHYSVGRKTNLGRMTIPNQNRNFVKFFPHNFRDFFARLCEDDEDDEAGIHGSHVIMTQCK